MTFYSALKALKIINLIWNMILFNIGTTDLLLFF